MADSDADQELADRYRSYLELCNAGELDRLGELVAPELMVNGTPTSRETYAAQLGAVLAAFPDYHWDLRHLVVNRPMLAAHLIDTGRHTGGDWLGVAPAGARIEIQELAVYAWSAGVIRQVWSTTDGLDTLRQLGQMLP